MHQKTNFVNLRFASQNSLVHVTPFIITLFK
jgi:hypothetical protein